MFYYRSWQGVSINEFIKYVDKYLQEKARIYLVQEKVRALGWPFLPGPNTNFDEQEDQFLDFRQDNIDNETTDLK